MVKDKKLEEDFSLNFSKITSFFQKKFKNNSSTKKESKSSDSSEDFSLDVKKIFSFFSNKKYLTLILIFIAIFFSVFFRSYSYNLPITDDWAYNNIYNNIRSQVTQSVNQQYPNLPSANKNEIVNEQVTAFMDSQSSEINSQIKLISESLKSRLQDETGQTYLLAIDPYTYYRYTENLIDNGHMGDLIVDGVPFDNHGNAPLGGFIRQKTFHPYFEFYFHKFMSIFTNNSLMKNIFFVPILLSALAVIPAFFIAKRRVGYLGAFIAAMIVAVHAAFLGRTAGGFSDTDAYNVLFPLFIAWMFIEAFEAKNLKKQVLFMGIGGFLVGLYSFAWSGWWYIFDFLLSVIFIYLVFLIVKHFVQKKTTKSLWSDELKSTLFSFGLFIFFSAIFVSLFLNFSSFMNFIKGPLSFTLIKQAAHDNLWPNVYTTVAELNPASIPSIVSQIGGKFFFFLASMGVVLSMIKRDKLKNNDYLLVASGLVVYLLLITSNFMRLSPIKYMIVFFIPLILGLVFLLRDKRNIDVKYAIFLAIWFVGTIYASTKGTRFLLLMVPIFGIALGIALGTLHSVLTRLTAKEFEVNKKIISTIIAILFLLLLINPIKVAHATAKGEIPSMNDAWWESLTRIKNNSSENAIITSWWDFGHWFKAIADRPVTFDGGSQNRPQAHWVGNILMSDNESESIAMLRMLDCGANSAFDEINKKYKDTQISIKIVNTMINLPEDEARSYLLSEDFTTSEIDTILGFSHCEPPEAFFITSGDMVGKAGVWSHFGSWDFDRSFIYKTVKKSDYDTSVRVLSERLNITEQVASNYYYEVQSLTSDQAANNWIAPWPNYATSWRSCVNNSEIVQCNIGLSIGESNLGQSVNVAGVLINLSKPEDTRFILSFVDRATGLSVGQQEALPQNIIIASDTLEKYDVGGTDMVLDVVYDQVNNRAMIVHPDLSQSIFTRLFFMDGRYTENFEKFSDLTDITGSRIIVWKVKWE